MEETKPSHGTLGRAHSVLLAPDGSPLTTGQVVAHGLHGVTVRGKGFALLGLEGPAARLDALLQSLACEGRPPVEELLRSPSHRRAYEHAGLASAPLTQPEQKWLAAQVARALPDRAVLVALLPWVAMRQREARAGGERLTAIQSNQSFPFPEPTATPSGRAGFVPFQ